MYIAILDTRTEPIYGDTITIIMRQIFEVNVEKVHHNKESPFKRSYDPDWSYKAIYTRYDINYTNIEKMCRYYSNEFTEQELTDAINEDLKDLATKMPGLKLYKAERIA